MAEKLVSRKVSIRCRRIWVARRSSRSSLSAPYAKMKLEYRAVNMTAATRSPTTHSTNVNAASARLADGFVGLHCIIKFLLRTFSPVLLKSIALSHAHDSSFYAKIQQSGPHRFAAPGLM